MSINKVFSDNLLSRIVENFGKLLDVLSIGTELWSILKDKREKKKEKNEKEF